jgi:hypothetical protein
MIARPPVSPKQQFQRQPLNLKHLVIAGQQLIFYVHATQGSGWFAEDANFKISARQTQKLTGYGYYCDVSLSPDGKTGAQGNEREATIKLWDFANDQFSNKRTVTGK